MCQGVEFVTLIRMILGGGFDWEHEIQRTEAPKARSKMMYIFLMRKIKADGLDNCSILGPSRTSSRQSQGSVDLASDLDEGDARVNVKGFSALRSIRYRV